MKIGDRVNALRKAKNLTLQELSEKTGVAIGSLSRIENNKMTGTIQSHAAICEVLGISLPELYKDLDVDSADPAAILDFQQAADVYIHNTTSSSTLLTSNVLMKKMMPCLLMIQVGGKTQEEENRSGTEKFCYVVKGSVEIHVGKTSRRLNAGDSLYFKSSQTHWMVNVGSEEASCLCVVTPPAL